MRQTRVSSNHGAKATIKTKSELITVAAGATTDSAALLLPADAIILAVGCKVKTVIPTATSFQMTGKNSTQAFGDAVLVAAGSSDPGTEGCPYYNDDADYVRLTITGSNPATATGKVRVVVTYLEVTVPA
jgi:hypothetical protein